MTTLFRPWTEMFSIDKTKKDFVEENNANAMPVVDGQLQQDSTVSTTVSFEPNRKSDDHDSREVKYKSVKEHIRRRSEKYSQKKSRKKAEEGLGDFVNASPTEVLPLPMASPCCSALTQLVQHPSSETVFGSYFPVPKAADWCSDLKNSPELLEAAMTHGLPPSLVEEYARLLTEQQRHLSERNRKQRPKKFRCPHCQVGFSNNGQLKGHIRIHTGERPFKCDAESCGKSFTRNEELTRHRRIHSGLRPFPCPECGKRFGRKDHLKKHVKTHYQQRYQLVPILPGHYPYLYGF